jgi:hypothetical protein
MHSLRGSFRVGSIKIGITDDAKSFVEATARRQGASEADVVRRALEAYRYIEDVAAKDGEIVIKRKNGTLERLVRF